MSIALRRMLRLRRLIAAACVGFMLTQAARAQGLKEPCDVVSIDSAGDYRISHSKIGGVATTHNRHGIAIWVAIVPPREPSLTDTEVLRLDVEVDLAPSAIPDCKILPHDPTPNAVTCVQSVEGIRGVRAQVKFRAGETGVEQKMATIVRYLRNEVFCDSP